MRERCLTYSIFFALIFCVSITGFSSDRYYMGEKTCRECHQDAFNQWRLTKHADAYAALAQPVSAQIARYSGIDVSPYESPHCMGCHTTAWSTEDWQRDDTFRFEDGMQCEACHGPASDYLEIHKKGDLDKSKAAGLVIPDETFCMICHSEKPSHQWVVSVKEFVYIEALKQIAHPRIADNPESADAITHHVPPGDAPTYHGVKACAECHEETNSQYIESTWRESVHAEAYAVLGTNQGFIIAKREGVHGNPQQSDNCLKCHSTGYMNNQIGAYDIADGVQCESCHGPGERYLSDPNAVNFVDKHKAGLLPVTQETCQQYHQQGIHDKDYDEQWFTQKIHPETINPQSDHACYKTPYGLAITQDGQTLLAACEASDSVIVINTSSGNVIAEIPVGNQPHDVCLTPDDQTAFVSNRGDDTVSVIDMESHEVISQIEVGDEPHGLVTDATGNYLYVANAGTYDVSVVDLNLEKEIKRLAAARGTWGVERSNDGKIYVTNNLSHFVPFREPCISETTVIDTNRAQVIHRYQIDEANLVQGVAASPDGDYALVTLIRTKNLVPMTRVMQGWVITNGIGILWKNGRIDQLLLDEPENFFADPTDVVITPDGQYAFVSAGGINQVAMIDLAKMKSLLTNVTDDERQHVFPNHLAKSFDFVIKRIDVGKSPRGMVCSPDGARVYVADGLDDTISVIDIAQQVRIRTLDLGGSKEITSSRLGEQIFHNASKTYGNQFSCHSCHPDGHVDGITYDIEPDGLGVNPVDNRTLRGILDTAPFKWTGKNPTLSRQCGPRLAVFFTRIDPFTPEQVVALEQYICTIIRPPNRYRHGKALNDTQRRGKELFERTHDNMGNLLKPNQRCIHCHPAPYYTNRLIFDVGTASELDTHGEFDIPHLNNIYDSAPYLHDGRAETLEEIWTLFNPYDEHGVTNDMTKDQLNDLIEYLKTL